MLRQRLDRWRRYRRMVRELDSYSPGQLTELSIAAGDIRRLARAACSD
jgi:uncharacterized protein YjiS (DUF1127 family)